MEAQGYHVEDNILYQDNRSAILLETNGKASSSKRTKHIKIRYFFISDRVNKGDLSIAWCPTEDMVGDYMTKPLQGAKFRKFRDMIMGVTPVASPGPGKAKSGGAVTSDNERSSTKPSKGIIKSHKAKPKPVKGKAPKAKFGAPETRLHHRSVL